VPESSDIANIQPLAVVVTAKRKYQPKIAVVVARLTWDGFYPITIARP
jgi:hypothetical protein